MEDTNEKVEMNKSVESGAVPPQTTAQYRNPILVYLFEISNSIGCILFPLILFLNPFAWFFPRLGSTYTSEDVLHCVNAMVVALIVFLILVGIPVILLLVDCFVIMKGVEGFKVSLMSIIIAPASYPMMRTAALEEQSGKRNFHMIFGSIVFITNIFLVVSIVYYVLRLLLTFMHVMFI